MIETTVTERKPPHLSQKRILFLINVDWFFVSHFLHLARRAQADGYAVTVLTRLEKTGETLRGEGFEVIDLPAERAGEGVRGWLQAITFVRQTLKRFHQAQLHGFGHFGIIVGTIALGADRKRPTVFTITGRGFLAADNQRLTALKRRTLATAISRMADRPAVRWIVENSDDATALGLTSDSVRARTVIVPGAGVDTAAFAPTPFPPAKPLKCIIVARAIWSKGIDIAVAAIADARARGLACELTIVGERDPDNPRSLSPETLAVYNAQPGVRWLGYRADVADLINQHHVVLLPSRGGEGTPKSLLEAAACGRMIVTTDVPGCRELAAACGGVSVPANDARAIADVLCRLWLLDIEHAGATARQTAIDRCSEDAIWNVVRKLYAEHDAKSA
jgi:glycosyltransferase involved in cell wall biosynthesis